MTTVPGWTDGLPYALFRANQAVQKRLVDVMEDLGVTITQLGIAVHLDALGRMSGSDLARHLAITPQSASTALGRLEELEWVRRIPHPIHKRVIWHEVTDTGAVQVREGRRRLRAFQNELAELLGSRLSTHVVGDLTSIARGLDGEEPLPGPLWPIVSQPPARTD